MATSGVVGRIVQVAAQGKRQPLDKNHVPATSSGLSAISAISPTTTTPPAAAAATTSRAAMGLGRGIQLCTEKLGKLFLLAAQRPL